MKTNLLQETASILKTAAKGPEDIVFIGSRDSAYACTWQQYQTLANFTYDNAALGQIVARDLIIVFNDGSSLSRVDDAGVERWGTDMLASQVNPPKLITRLHNGVTKTVAELQK